MQPYVVGIDIGTGSTKALAINASGEVLCSAQQHYGTAHPQPGFAEQNAEDIWNAFVQCVQDVVAERGGTPAVISLSSCMHSLMAVEGNGGQTDPAINVFWAALAFIIVGSGFLKANISVMVGQLYKLTDIRRDGAYTIFYMGINVGAAIGTILVGVLASAIAMDKVMTKRVWLAEGLATPRFAWLPPGASLMRVREDGWARAGASGASTSTSAPKAVPSFNMWSLSPSGVSPLRRTVTSRSPSWVSSC